MNFPTIEEHEEFVKCLEEFGSQNDGNEWSSIASKMNWSIEDVKVYAFWYMEQLQIRTQEEDIGGNRIAGDCVTNRGGDDDLVETDNNNIMNDEENENDDDGDDDDDNDELWTFGECALFDTLIIVYDAKTINRWEKIASLIPNKNNHQCRERWKGYKTKMSKES